MSTRIKHDDILLLEQPFLKVPTDGLRSSFRLSQRVIERDFDKLNANLKELSAKLQHENRSHHQAGAFPAASGVAGTDLQRQEEAITALDGLLTKARGLKRKIDDTFYNPQSGTKTTLNRIKSRLEHLQDLYAAEFNHDPSYTKFSNVRLDRHLVDYMLREGYTSSAQSLSRVAQIEPLVDETLFAELARIEKALSQHSCTEALSWCKENSGALKKMQSTLEFELRYQEFIELAKSRKFHQAISYSQKQLVPWQTTHLSQISQAMTLLAFDRSTTCPPYARLYCDSRWSDLLCRFRWTLFALHAIPEQPLLHLSLSVGLASLKLPACYAKRKPGDKALLMSPLGAVSLVPAPGTRVLVGSPPPTTSSSVNNSYQTPEAAQSSSNYDPILLTTLNSDDQVVQPNRDCPICDGSGLGELAKECPWSHHLNSIIVCSLTGRVVKDGESLAVLPNGRVYSRDGLEQLAYKDEGRIRCPRTGQIFGMNEVRRVFIS